MPIINNYFYSQKEPSDKIGFDYYYQTFFYNVYTKYDEKSKTNIYYMATSDKKSLLARLNFYKKYISEIEYPVIDKQGRPEYVAGNSLLVIQQVLSLPEECFLVNNSNNYLSPDEVIERIIFTDELNTTEQPNISDDYFLSNEFYKKLVNHLISNGFYFLNIEALSTTLRVPSFDRTPFIIDEEKFLQKYEKPTAERIYISFSSIVNVTPSDYLKYYKKVDDMSIKEQLAYANDVKDSEDNLDLEVKDSLLEYYYSVLRRECRSYFNCHENTENRSIGYNVLDHESGNHFTKYNYFAFGTHFSLVATKTRLFKKDKGNINEEIKPSEYKLLSCDISRLRFTFNTVKNYLLLNPQYGFMPHHFIKLMGIPYEVINLVRNFNFKEGTFDHFIKLIPVLNVKEKINYNVVNINGQVVDFDEDELNYVLMNLSNKNLYIYNYDKNSFYDENIIFGRTKSKLLLKFITEILRQDKFSSLNKDVINYRKKLINLHKGEKNKTKAIYNFALEIAYTDNIEFPTISINDSSFDEDEESDELIDSICTIKYDGIVYNSPNYLEKDEIVYNDFLTLPYIHLGNNFIGYSKKENDQIYFDEVTKTAIKEFMEIINLFYKKGIHHYYFYSSSRDISLSKIRIYKHAKKILGLPSRLNDLIVLSNKKNEVYNIESTLSNLSFKNGISIEENNLNNTFISDPRISYLLLFKDILLRYHLIPFIYLGKINNNYFVPYYKLSSDKSFINEFEKNYYMLGFDIIPPFSYPSFDILYSEPKKDIELDDIFINHKYYQLLDIHDYEHNLPAFKYLFSLEKYYYYSSYERLFTTNHFYNQENKLSTDNKKVHILYGEIFNAYSYDNKNYFLDIKDLDKIYDAYQFNHKLIQEYNFGDDILDQCIFGIPYQLSIKLLNKIKNKKTLLTIDEFKNTFVFKEKPKVESDNIIYHNLTKTRNNPYSIYDVNSLVRYKAISNGLFISHYSAIEIDFFLNFEDTNLEYEDFISSTNQVYYVYAGKNITGEVESFLKPKKSLLFALLQNFTRNLSSLSRVDVQKLLKLKYHVEMLYDEDPLFIYKLINKINDSSKKKIYKFLENTSYLNNSRIDLPYKIKKEELVDFLVAFIIYVIHSLLKILCKYQKD